LRNCLRDEANGMKLKGICEWNVLWQKIEKRRRREPRQVNENFKKLIFPEDIIHMIIEVAIERCPCHAKFPGSLDLVAL